MASSNKIDLKVLKRILSLDSKLPDKYAKIWVIVDEMHDRLILEGVDCSLTREQS